MICHHSSFHLLTHCSFYLCRYLLLIRVVATAMLCDAMQVLGLSFSLVNKNAPYPSTKYGVFRM